MIIESTQDISLSKLSDIARKQSPSFASEVSTAQFSARAMEVPSWVKFIADTPWWIQALGASATVYVTGILSEAGKDTWRARAEAAQATARGIDDLIERFGNFVVQATTAGSARTFVVLAVPMKNGFDEIKLRLDYQDALELEFQISLFVHSLPEIEALLHRELGDQKRAVGGVYLEYSQQDFSLAATWLDRDSLTQVAYVISNTASQSL